MLFSSNYKLIQNLGIEIDSKNAKQMGTKYWMIIYYAFCQYGTIQSFSKNLIKKISLGPTGEYNIIIKWLSDLSGIELILNQIIDNMWKYGTNHLFYMMNICVKKL